MGAGGCGRAFEGGSAVLRPPPREDKEEGSRKLCFSQLLSNASSTARYSRRRRNDGIPSFNRTVTCTGKREANGARVRCDTPARLAFGLRPDPRRSSPHVLGNASVPCGVFLYPRNVLGVANKLEEATRVSFASRSRKRRCDSIALRSLLASLPLQHARSRSVPT